MSTLRNRAIRLAWANPELRGLLLPILASKTAGMARLSPAQVVADIKRHTGFVGAVQTPKVKKSGFQVRKLNQIGVWVEYKDWAKTSQDHGQTEFDQILQALLDSGYTLVHNFLHPTGRIVGGPEALAWARKMGGVAVIRATE